MSIENDPAQTDPTPEAPPAQEIAQAPAAPDQEQAAALSVQASSEAVPAAAAEAAGAAEMPSQRAGEEAEPAALEELGEVPAGSEAQTPEEVGERTAASPKAELSPPQCAAKLAEMFPALFGPEGPPKPIKLRIQADIQQRAPGLFTRKVLSIVLHRHTTTTPYLKALVAAPARFDLDGQPAGEIAEEHRQAAREEVERRRAIVTARRAAEAQARGPRGPRSPHPQAPKAGADTPSADALPPPSESSAGDASDRPRQERPPRPHGGQGEGREGREGKGGRRPERTGAPRGGHATPEWSRGNGPRLAHRGAGPRQGPASTPVTDGAARPARPRPEQRPARPDPRSEAPRPRPHPEGPQASVPGPEDAARRERALLLRTYEASSLTKANFCVLKRITEAELDAQLALARQERGPARPRP